MESKRWRGIDFEVAPGETFGLLGPNGAGKSTTVGMLTTTIAPSGWPRTAGWLRHRRPAAGGRAISSVVFQEAVVDRELSGLRNLDLHARLWGVSAKEGELSASPKLRESLGLAELIDRPVASYSGGRVAAWRSPAR